ncbi:ABC transporter permease [Krasilnikoviella flava]|uniref:Oligopeptide transport system permease protein n=1 Tax=Krasilnikoviella flava TaxID=526729 RepID=A0A1T5IF53_9MICO|nr:ABC transporter permease [Krasilnikoviella flava]SKC37794.1 oligopeptide transport system permease protein [Krasilnikoviella flava]
MPEPTAATATPDAPGTGVSASLGGDAWRRLRRRPDVIVSALVVVFFTVMAAFPTLFTSTDPQRCIIGDSKTRPQGLGATHPLGTDVHGCDMLAQLVHGARPSLLLAFVVVGASVVIGVVLGLLAGYYLGWVDTVVSRTIEVFLVIPLLLAALLLLSLFRNVSVGSGAFDVILLPALVLTLFGWMGYSRYVRASTLEAKNLDYVTAARALGASDLRIMVRHVLPNAIGPVTALVPTAIAGVISAEAVLAFLGIGVRPPAISWGIMITNGAEWVTGGYPYLLLIPLGCLILTVLALVVLGDALRDALDPRLR